MQRKCNGLSRKEMEKMQQPKHRNKEGELLTVAQAAEQTNLGTGTIRRLAAESNAVIKIGASLRIDMPKLMKHIRINYGV